MAKQSSKTLISIDDLLADAVNEMMARLKAHGLLEHVENLYLDRSAGSFSQQPSKNSLLLSPSPSNYLLFPNDYRYYWSQLLIRLVPTEKYKIIFPDSWQIESLGVAFSKIPYHSVEYFQKYICGVYMAPLEYNEKKFLESAIAPFQTMIEFMQSQPAYFRENPEKVLIENLNLSDDRLLWQFSDLLRTMGFNLIADETSARLFSMVLGLPECSRYDRWCSLLFNQFSLDMHRTENDNQQKKAENVARRFDFIASFFEDVRSTVNVHQLDGKKPLLSHPFSEKLHSKEEEDWEEIMTKIRSGDRSISDDELLKYVCRYLPNSSYERLRKENPELFSSLRLQERSFFRCLISDEKNDEIGTFLKSVALLAQKFGNSEENQPQGDGKLKSFTSPELVVEFLRKKFAGAENELCIALFFDSQQQLVHEMEVSAGTVDKVIVEPRQIFAPALRLRCHSLIIAHNHPAGNPQPSQADDLVTQKMKRTGEIVGIKFIDHIIISRDSYFSYREHQDWS